MSRDGPPAPCNGEHWRWLGTWTGWPAARRSTIQSRPSRPVDGACVRDAEGGRLRHDEQLRPGNTEALRVVDADLPQDRKRLRVFHRLCNRCDAHDLANLVDCL